MGSGGTFITDAECIVCVRCSTNATVERCQFRTGFEPSKCRFKAIETFVQGLVSSWLSEKKEKQQQKLMQNSSGKHVCVAPSFNQLEMDQDSHRLRRTETMIVPIAAQSRAL